MHRFHIFPFGCQMNRHDAETLAGRLLEEGYEAAEDPEDADIVLYFTCSVRDHAEQRVWSHLGRWRAPRETEKVRALGVLGCMSERLGEKIRSRMPHVDLVVGPRRLGEVSALLGRVLEGGGPHVAIGDGTGDGAGAAECDECPDPARAVRPNPFQAMLPVMRGCDCGCTYCVVPRVRGREVSLPPVEIERSARELVDRGVVEITLLGQNIDRYGLTLSPRETLAALLGRLAALCGLKRLRFVTSNPRNITDDLLRAMRDNPNVMPYLHVPAQSGSDSVLERMGRGYTRKRYLEVVESARLAVPGIEIASDFIVGFPGETDADFEETLSLVKQVEFQNAFIFKYSPRPGTPAARFADDVPDEVKRERHRVLSDVQLEVSLHLNRARVGREVEVLAEGVSRRDPSRFTGRTPTGRIVAFTSERDPPSRAEAASSGEGPTGPRRPVNVVDPTGPRRPVNVVDPTGRIVRVLVEDATALVLLGKTV